MVVCRKGNEGSVEEWEPTCDSVALAFEQTKQLGKDGHLLVFGPELSMKFEASCAALTQSYSVSLTVASIVCSSKTSLWRSTSYSMPASI
eukprot:1029096-Amphidinium_carterae.1